MRPLLQTLAFVRREIAEVLRQPFLLLVLVVGPFAVLLLFGVGYRNEPLILRTLLVGDRDAPLMEVASRFEDQLGDAISLEGMTEDLVEATTRLQADEVDLLVVFPDDPIGTVLGGVQAEIVVLHEKLDPIQQVAVDFASRLATDEINAAVLAEVVRQGQTSLAPADELLLLLEDDAVRLAQETSRPGAVEAAGRIEETARYLSVVLGASGVVGESVGGRSRDPAVAAAFLAEEIADQARRMGRSADAGDGAAQARELRLLIDELAGTMESVETVDPAILVRPFVGRAELLTAERVRIIDFFAPAAVALLIGHLGVSIAALSFVRDQRLGLVELYRVGPVGTVAPLVGKFLAFVLLALLTAGALLLLVVEVLEVPSIGPLVHLVTTVALVAAASVAIGLALSLLAGSDSQAVQYSMLVLLASLFFSGFVLDLERLRQPALGVAAVLPVTYGTRMMREVMLLGRAPDVADQVGLALIAAGGLAAAGLLLRRRLRVR